MTGVSTDSRTAGRGAVFFALKGARCDGHDFVDDVLARGAAAAVVSREVSVPPEHRDRLIFVDDTLRALGDSAREHRRTWGGTVVGITGSNGKTTTREMVHHVLQGSVPCKRSPKSFNTEVGVPLTIFQAEPDDRALIVEMGTNAPGEIASLAAIAEPDMGIITNIGESHLEGLGSVEGVARAKAELFQALPPYGAAFLIADSPWTEFLRPFAPCEVITYGIGEGSDFRGASVECADEGHMFIAPGGVRVTLNVPGLHNVRNALAALAVAKELGVPVEVAAARLASFRLPDLRFHRETINGVLVVSDCYNANPDSMRAALDTFGRLRVSGRRAAVLGDMLELGRESVRLHRSLGQSIARSNLDALWTVGEFADCTADSAVEHGFRGTVRFAAALDEVMDETRDYLKPGDAVLVKGSRGMKLERFAERLRAAALQAIEGV